MTKQDLLALAVGQKWQMGGVALLLVPLVLHISNVFLVEGIDWLPEVACGSLSALVSYIGYSRMSRAIERIHDKSDQDRRRWRRSTHKEAIAILRSYGIKVGLLGASLKQVRSL